MIPFGYQRFILYVLTLIFIFTYICNKYKSRGCLPLAFMKAAMMTRFARMIVTASEVSAAACVIGSRVMSVVLSHRYLIVTSPPASETGAAISNSEAE